MGVITFSTSASVNVVAGPSLTNNLATVTSFLNTNAQAGQYTDLQEALTLAQQFLNSVPPSSMNLLLARILIFHFNGTSIHWTYIILMPGMALPLRQELLSATANFNLS